MNQLEIEHICSHWQLWLVVRRITKFVSKGSYLKNMEKDIPVPNRAIYQENLGNANKGAEETANIPSDRNVAYFKRALDLNQRQRDCWRYCVRSRCCKSACNQKTYWQHFRLFSAEINKIKVHLQILACTKHPTAETPPYFILSSTVVACVNNITLTFSEHLICACFIIAAQPVRHM